MLPISISNKFRAIEKTSALIDSGSEYCLINSKFAEHLLYVDYKSGKRVDVIGVCVDNITGYAHELEYEILNMKDSKKIKAPFIFLKSNNFSILLGQHGFFDEFTVCFSFENAYINIT